MTEIAPLRINDCGLADYPTGGRLGPRTMSDYEIVWIERGLCRWESDGEIVECPPGSVLICQPGVIDTWHWDATQMTRHGYLHFEFLHDERPRFPIRRDVKGDDVLRPLLRHAVWLARLGSSSNDLLAAAALRQALMWFVTGAVMQSEPPTTSALHPVLLRALRDLRERWKDDHRAPPSIADWARSSGVSRGHLARICRQYLNVTPQELLRYLRLDSSLPLLGRTNLNVSQISEICGFQSQFHFSRCFKEAYGHSPRAMRKKLLAGGDRPLSKVIGLRRMIQIIG